eukprot:394169_1
MSFNLPYQFKQSGRLVVVQHSHNGHVRVSPNNMGQADGGGGHGAFAQWRIMLEGGQHCRLQSTKTNKYLRIFRNGNVIDVDGGTGPFTKFKIHYHSRPNGIKLESDRFPGRYLAVNPNRTMKIGGGGHHCNLWIKREGQAQQVHHVQQPRRAQVQSVQHVGQGSFNAPYLFQQNNTVIIKSNYGKTLRVSPNNTHNGDGNGGTGQYARWRVIKDGNGVIKLQNTHSNKYLRIENNNSVNVGGTGGALTRFRYHVHRHPNGIKLESCRFPGKYVAIHPNGTLTHGTGGIHTQLSLWRDAGGNAPKANFVVRQAQPQQANFVVQQAKPQGEYNAAYQFQKNNEVVIRSNYGKHLRVNPNNTKNADGNGGTGQYARWRVILDGGRVIKLQNTHSGKYLRIEGNHQVNVGGGGGAWTRFRYHVHRHPNGVKLESCKIPGKYVAIHPNGNVTHGTGGIHTQLSLWRRGGAAPQVVVRQPQPQVVVVQQPQPQVIVQRQPQVIVQNPSINVQQRQMEQQMAAQQQQMNQQMAAQQQQMTQQMEQLRIQNEISLKSQQQQMELEKQQMEQQMQQNMALQQQELDAQRQLMEQQQQMMSNVSSASIPTQQEGVNAPVNPFYGNVDTLDGAISYPVLNQAVEEKEAAPVMMPVQGQEAANAVYLWLHKLGMERYYKTFIENGYDVLDSVGEISREDLKEMGVALGHIKTIVRASLTAPFVNRKLRVKCMRYGTYLNQHDFKNKNRCVLQHSENENKPGSVWLFELLDDNVFTLKHVQTATFLRIIQEDGAVDTRSPLDQHSKMILEKHENSKGIYYIKESVQENYVKFDEPRTFGYNKVEATKKRDASCRMALELIK